MVTLFFVSINITPNKVVIILQIEWRFEVGETKFSGEVPRFASRETRLLHLCELWT